MKVLNQSMTGAAGLFFIQNASGGNRTHHRIVRGKLSDTAICAATRNGNFGGPVFGGPSGAEAAELWEARSQRIAAGDEDAPAPTFRPVRGPANPPAGWWKR